MNDEAFPPMPLGFERAIDDDRCPICGFPDQNGELCEDCMIEQTQFAMDEIG